MSGSTDPDTSETSEWLDSLRAVLHHQGSASAFLYRLFRRLLTLIRYRRNARRVPTGTETLNIASVRSFDGTPSQSSCGPTRSPLSWEATSQASSRLRRFTISALDISGMRRLTRMAAISFTCRATRLPAFTRALL